MESPSSKTIGLVGGAAVLFAAIQSARQLLGWIDEAERWKAMIGPITTEGVRQLALLVGMMLMAPMVAQWASGWIRPRLRRHREFRAAKRRSESQFPHLREDELKALETLLEEGPQVCPSAPDDMVKIVRWLGYEEEVVALDPAVRKPLKRYLAAERRSQTRGYQGRTKAALVAATKWEREVLWLFGRPHLEEPARFILGRPELIEAAKALSRADIIEIEQGWVDEGHRKYQSMGRPASFRLRPEAAPLVDDMIFGRTRYERFTRRTRTRRASVRISPSS